MGGGGVVGGGGQARRAARDDPRGRRRQRRGCAAAPTCPTAGTTPSPTRSPVPWRWARCRRGTSRPWPGRWAPGWRAPAACWPTGTLTLPKARLIAQLFEPLDEQEAARAEALILDELAGKTYPQVERLAWRAALAVAPDVAERRRAAGERRARVTVFREDSGAVGLSGRDLPAAEALAGHANVLARARQYQASGAFGGQSRQPPGGPRLRRPAQRGQRPGADRVRRQRRRGTAGGPGPDARRPRRRHRRPRARRWPGPDDRPAPRTGLARQDDGDGPDPGDGEPGPDEPGTAAGTASGRRRPAGRKTPRRRLRRWPR